VSEAVAELARLATYRHVTAGLVPEWARRPLMPWELRSGVNYAALDRILRDAYTRTENLLGALRAELAMDLAQHVGDVTDRVVVDRRVTAWATGRPRTSVAIAEETTRAVVRVLRRTERAARLQVYAEAAHQNVRASVAFARVLDPDDSAYDPDRDPFRTLAASPVGIVQGKVEGAALAVSQRPESPEAPIRAAADVNIAAGVDSARQATHIANGEGRLAAVTELPEPEEVYASELLDSRTCSPCERMDGTVFASVAAAELSYPGSGPYRYCDGGPRCRGTLVFVWGES
jgi:hypothetical protein